MSTRRRSRDEGREIVDAIVQDAEKWAAENGLAGPFTSSLAVKEFGFVVDVQGPRGHASLTFQRDGRRSMYELKQRFGEEGRR